MPVFRIRVQFVAPNCLGTRREARAIGATNGYERTRIRKTGMNQDGRSTIATARLKQRVNFFERACLSPPVRCLPSTNKGTRMEQGQS